MCDEMIVSQFPDAIICSDVNGKIIRWNDAAVNIFGYSEQEALGASLNLIIPPHLQDAHWHGFYAAVKSGNVKHKGEVILTGAMHKNGTRIYVDMIFGLLKNGQGAVVGVLASARENHSKSK